MVLLGTALTALSIFSVPVYIVVQDEIIDDKKIERVHRRKMVVFKVFILGVVAFILGFLLLTASVYEYIQSVDTYGELVYDLQHSL